MNQRVFVCYDAENPFDISSQYGCGPNQCRFEAGISRGDRENRLWFMKPEYSTRLDNDGYICSTAIMQSPTAKVTPITIRPPSCRPLITNGGRIKLSVKAASTECFLTVKNAKIWIPTTTLAPTTRRPADPSPATQSSPADEGEQDFFEKAADYFCAHISWC
uniref:Uncharacterized protein n=1 Tax=Panagrolaimus sp. PS1159 TaxID=55785 RepID=A0AC35EY63_9BILA